ncbi:MAG: hypothetical protein N5P05_000082 [Chroococcopsis gigantea SAG 12.99]|jgi:hypothetical protein|nr:hypothetical protein [Chroococcopsis gigantea SAG 12.99]
MIANLCVNLVKSSEDRKEELLKARIEISNQSPNYYYANLIKSNALPNKVKNIQPDREYFTL